MNKLRWLLAALLVVAMVPAEGTAQQRGSIRGQVTDQSTGRPIAGAQIVVVGTALGTVTNDQGQFAIPAVAAGTHTLEISFLGYKQVRTQVTVTAGSPATVEVRMEADVLNLDELVVVGYGAERRRNISGSISSIRPEQLQELPTPSVETVLQGRMPGVQVTQNSGNPGAAISVRVRGASSISAGNQPLYVVDGVPMTQGNFSGINGSFGGQDIDALSDLNPNEIERIEVLKDASAAAIYGSRASNGVVLITTKRGVAAAERPQINFNAYYGTQQDWKRVEFLNTDEYIEVYNEARRNHPDPSRRHPAYFGYVDDGVDNVWELDRINTDWLDQMFRSAPMYSMTGSIAGGTERTRYFVSGTVFSQDGIVRGFGYERLNGRLNLDYTASDRLTLGTNVALTRGLTERARSDNTIYGPFANAIANPPFEPVYNDDGTYYETLYANPVGLAKENYAEERSVRVLGNTFANFHLTPDIDIRASVGLDHLNLRSYMYDSPIVGPAVGSNGSAVVSDRYVTKLLYEGTATFSRDFGENHAFSGVVGTSYEQNTNEFNRVTGQQFPTEYFRYLTSAATITDGTSSLSDWSLISYFARVSYSFANRYSATVNLRTDGSSRFGADRRFGTFPSASFLWRVSEESFMQGQGLFNDLALRVSYGRTGNQQDLGDFASRGLYAGGANYEDLPGIYPNQLANPELKWETTDQLDIGTDFTVLGNRLSVTLDYYIKKTKDLLVERPVPQTTGFSSIWYNVGSMENRGIELTARAQLLRGGQDGLNWTVDFNIAKNDNKVTELYNGEPMNFGFVSRVEEGQPLGAFYGYVTDGIFRTPEEVAAHAFQSTGTAPGDIRFKDLNGDGVINDDDRTIIGSPWPDFTGGLTNTLSYRGFDLSLFVQFSQGNEIYNANRIYQEAYGLGYLDNMTKRALERWTPENPDAKEPRAVWGDPNNNIRDSDRFIEDGSYIRLKNAVLGYTFPQSVAGRFGMRSLRVYLQGQNLLTSTNYSGFDPEVNYAGEHGVTRGTDFYTLPQARSFTVGFNVGF